MRYSIRAALRTDKETKQNGKLPIHYVIQFQNSRLKVATGKEVDPRNWNAITGRVKNGAEDAQGINFSLQHEITNIATGRIS